MLRCTSYPLQTTRVLGGPRPIPAFQPYLGPSGGQGIGMGLADGLPMGAVKAPLLPLL